MKQRSRLLNVSRMLETRLIWVDVRYPAERSAWFGPGYEAYEDMAGDALRTLSILDY